MRKLLYILIVALSSWLMTACKKEAKLTPTTAPENVHSEHDLPQGNHPYDADIQQLFDRYHTLFLYKYVRHDLYYAVTEDLGGTYDSASDKTIKAGYFDVPADQAYVGKQLDLLKELWLHYYPDSLLKGGLPQKVYLVDSFYFAYPGPGKPTDNWPEMHDVFSGGDYMLTAWGGARIESITPEEKYSMKGQLNSIFLGFAHTLGTVRPTAAFKVVTDYSALKWNNTYAVGVIEYNWYGSNGPDFDWDSFVKTIVSNSYTVLTSPGGVLDPSVDVNGLIRKKYDIVIAYFMSNYGVDLQAIGNAGS